MDSSASGPSGSVGGVRSRVGDGDGGARGAGPRSGLDPLDVSGVTAVDALGVR